MTDTATRLLAVLTEQFGVIDTAETDVLDAVYARTFETDSLDRVETVMAIEDEFELSIDDDEADAIDDQITLRGLVELIDRKLAEKVPA